MPKPYVKDVAKKKHITVHKAESRWQRAKQRAGAEGHAGDYGYITGIFKRMNKLAFWVGYNSTMEKIL